MSSLIMCSRLSTRNTALVCRCVLLALPVTCWLGCNGRPARVSPPPLDPQQAGQQAIDLYDADGSGALSQDECSKCPAIASLVKKYDSNGDGQITADEITAQLKAWTETTVGLTGASFTLRLNGRPLEGATVELVPEPFLRSAIKPASGTSSQNGRVSPSLAAEELPEGIQGAMHYGLYKIKVTHPQLEIPPQYNTETTLGIEVPPHFDHYNPPVINLKTK